MNILNYFVLILLFNLSLNNTIAESKDMILGMVICSGKYWVDQIRITVDSWISYYNWIETNMGTEAANKVLPDTNELPSYIWEYIIMSINKETKGLVTSLSPHTAQPKTNIKKCPELMVQNLFLENLKIKKCRIGYFPITGITYEQVINFCRWRTVNIGKSELIYTLPSINEWNEIVLLGLSE